MRHGDMIIILSQPLGYIDTEWQDVTKLWRTMIVERENCHPPMELLDVVRSLGTKVVNFVMVLMLIFQNPSDLV